MLHKWAGVWMFNHIWWIMIQDSWIMIHKLWFIFTCGVADRSISRQFLLCFFFLSFCSEYSDCTMLHVSANNFASVWMNNQLWWIKSWFPIKNDDSWILIHDKRISDCTMLYGSANNFTSVWKNQHLWWVKSWFPIKNGWFMNHELWFIFANSN